MFRKPVTPSLVPNTIAPVSRLSTFTLFAVGAASFAAGYWYSNDLADSRKLASREYADQMADEAMIRKGIMPGK